MEPLNHPNEPENGKKQLTKQQTMLIAAAAAVLLLACGFAYQSWRISQLRMANAASTVDAGSSLSTEKDAVPAEKSALIDDLLRLNSSLDASALAELSVTELMQLQTAGAPGMPIGLNAAAYAVEEYAGTLEASSVTWTGEPDLDDPVPHYDIELHHVSKGDFDYEVDAFTGEILSGVKSIWDDPLFDLVSTESNSDVPEYFEVSGGISNARAKKIALSDAGFPEEDTEYCDVKLDYDGGRPESFDVEFSAGGVKYEYEIDPYNGSILKSTQSSGYIPPAAPESLLTAEQAAAIAYSDASVGESSVSSLKTKLDWDDGVRVFEVEFVSDGTKYEYEIDASDGTIRKSEQEASSHTAAVPTPPSSSDASYTYIGSDTAKNTAFQHAGVNAADAKNIKCELDREHGLACYEIEFTVGKTEYEYEVDAVTGMVLKAEMD